MRRNILLNPGPATTTNTVKKSQVVPDICPREKEFIQLISSIRMDLNKIGGENENYTCILFAGSGTAVMDATINSVIPDNKKILIINNGAYGERLSKIADAYNIKKIEAKFDWTQIPDLKQIEKELQNDKDISHIAMIHHETTTGILNPLKEVGELAKRYNKGYIIDTISSFAGIPINLKESNIDFMMSTSNKCIQGMAGIAFVICKKSEIEKLKDYPKRSFYLNLYQQYKCFEDNGEMQFTPPVQVAYALKQAIKEFLEEGAENRFRRYKENYEVLIKGLKKLKFKFLIEEKHQSGILVTLIEPENFNFKEVHDKLYEKGFTIYPGKLYNKKTFRLAVMGAINSRDIKKFLRELKGIMK